MKINNYPDKVKKVVKFIKKHGSFSPSAGIILGSGLRFESPLYKEEIRIPYKDIPGFPISTVKGHQGRLSIGKFENKDLIIFSGRFHIYEGYTLPEVVFPVMVTSELKASNLIVTNAAGSLKKKLSPGTFMIIKDHINLMGRNPLLEITLPEKKDKFIDMTSAYDKEFILIAEKIAGMKRIKVSPGVLVGLPGPSYETSAEVKMLSKMGGDAVCMSTIAEVIMARYLGLRVSGISLITNYASGISSKSPTHEEVLLKGEEKREIFSKYIELIIQGIMNSDFFRK